MKIDFRTLGIAGLVCGFFAAIAPIDTAWSQCISMEEVASSASASSGPKYLVNGQPATAAQVKLCQQCRNSSTGACAQFKASADALTAQRSEAKDCFGAGGESSACAKARKAAADAKNKEAEQKQQASGKKNTSTFNTGNTVQAKSLTPTNPPPKPTK